MTTEDLHAHHASSTVDGNDHPLSSRQLYGYDDNGVQFVCIPRSFQTAKHLEAIVDLTCDLIALRKSLCREGNEPVKRFGKHLDQRLRSALQLTPDELKADFPKHAFHPYVELFMRSAARESLFELAQLYGVMTDAEGKAYATARQRMLVALRAGARDPELRKRVKKHKDKVRRNVRQIVRYTHALFARHARLLVVRVDCLFNEDFVPGHDWGAARVYRQGLIKFLNKDLPKVIQSQFRRDAGEKPVPIVGYVIGTEYGIEAGWHFHVTLFLDGDTHRAGIDIAATICQRWKDDLTAGNGRYYNCNLAASQRRYGAGEIGVGVIHRHDEAMRKALDRVVSYPGKGCYYAEAQTGTKDRLLNKGGWPKAKDPKKGGRPEGQELTRPYNQWDAKKNRFRGKHIPVEPIVPPPGF